MSSMKGDNTKKILKILSERQAVPAGEIATSYPNSRALKNLVEGGFVELRKSDNREYAKLTRQGKFKLDTIRLLGEDTLVPQSWDGLWRIIILDLPEERKAEREALRYLLKKANFVCIKNTVWISPFPYEHIFLNIKKDLGLTTELMILVTEKVDEETRKAFLEAVRK